MLTIHHLNNSRSQRVLWLLEELELPYEIRHYQRGADMQAPAELRPLHPLGKSPILTEGAFTLAETGAIVTYILETHARGRMIPAQGSPDYWRYQHFLHHAEGTAMPPLLLKLVLATVTKKTPALVRPVVGKAMQATDEGFVTPQIERNLAYWERSLADTGWFAGPDLSAADIMMSFPVEASASRADLSGYGNLTGFLSRIHARPAYRAALDKGGPYAFAE
ncbi:glutathione S-transferase [Aureimonas altamirensis]|uniref:glutathione S-transferase n=1 Tax=Aureimonas altamirensis TaxID=370622 RepID=UPI0030164C82